VFGTNDERAAYTAHLITCEALFQAIESGADRANLRRHLARYVQSAQRLDQQLFPALTPG
jgi:hypothetical protein